MAAGMLATQSPGTAHSPIPRSRGGWGKGWGQHIPALPGSMGSRSSLSPLAVSEDKLARRVGPRGS